MKKEEQKELRRKLFTLIKSLEQEEPILFESFDKEKSVVITTMGQKVIRELQSSMKQELNLNCFDCNKSLQDCTCMEDTIDMKQESIEEAAKNYAKNKTSHKTFQEIHERDFKEGAKCQQERMYSEEEVIQLLIKFNQEIQEVEDVRGWFEQFKKK